MNKQTNPLQPAENAADAVYLSPAARLLRDLGRLATQYPVRTFATVGLIGDSFTAASGFEYNAVRLTAAGFGLAGDLILMFLADRHKDPEAAKAIDNQDRPTWRLRRMLDPFHYPIEAGLACGLAEAAIQIVAGGFGQFLDKTGHARPLEVASTVLEVSALLIGNFVKQIPETTPKPDGVFARTGDFVQRHPLLVSSAIFVVSGAIYMGSGFAAHDHFVEISGGVYTASDLVLGFASKRKQGDVVGLQP